MTAGPGQGAGAIFLDRDGVITANVLNPATGEFEAAHALEDFAVLPGAVEALRRFDRAGWPLFLVSNQPDAALGKAGIETIQEIHARMMAHLAPAGIRFVEAYYCYHHPKGHVAPFAGPCACRKPSPHFLLKARDAHGVDLSKSWMIGDRETDIACGRAAGARTIRVGEAADTAAEACVPDLTAAADRILSRPPDQRPGKRPPRPRPAAA